MSARRSGRSRSRLRSLVTWLTVRIAGVSALVVAAGFAVGSAGLSRRAESSETAIDRLAAMVSDGLPALAVTVAAVVLVVAVRRIYRRLALPRIDDWRDAEAAAADWLRRAGCRDVALTTAGADGGIDVVSTEWAVQVKHTAKKVGRPAVQQLVGAALALERSPVLFSTAGFTAPAKAYADQHDVALIELALDGRARALNGRARQIGRHGRWPFTMRHA